MAFEIVPVLSLDIVSAKWYNDAVTKIAYISDLRLEFLADNLTKKNGKECFLADIAGLFCARINNLVKPDFTIIAGDISHCPADVIRFLGMVDEQIKTLVYVTLGNHDYYLYVSIMFITRRILIV